MKLGRSKGFLDHRGQTAGEIASGMSDLVLEGLQANVLTFLLHSMEMASSLPDGFWSGTFHCLVEKNSAKELRNKEQESLCP